MKPAGDVAQVHLDNFNDEYELTDEQLHADDPVDKNYPEAVPYFETQVEYQKCFEKRLAKARKEEREEVLREVEELLMDETLISYASWRRSTRKYGGTQEEYERLEDILNNQNQLRAELRTKLNQLKGNHETNKV